MKNFDPLEPFLNKKLLKEVSEKLKNFEYKLYGKISLRHYRGKPTKYEFDWDLGLIHFTEQDFKGLSRIFEDINNKWKTKMTFCIYPALEKNRHMVMNIRGSPKAPSDLK